MNTYTKFCPNVWVAQCEETYKKGDEIIVTTKHGKENECIVWNYLGMKNGLYLYSITRADGFNSQERANGFLFYDAAKAYSPEVIRQVRKMSPAFDEAFRARAKKPDHEISVRIDKRTVVMVKASKWTPDYAERYKARMEASKPQQRWSGDQCMRMYNDTIKTPKPKKKKK